MYIHAYSYEVSNCCFEVHHQVLSTHRTGSMTVRRITEAAVKTHRQQKLNLGGGFGVVGKDVGYEACRAPPKLGVLVLNMYIHTYIGVDVALCHRPPGLSPTFHTKNAFPSRIPSFVFLSSPSSADHFTAPAKATAIASTLDTLMLLHSQA
jgi:hypothetical protein